MGRIRRSWELVKRSFAILQSDKELLLLPITLTTSCVLVSAVIVGGALMVAYFLMLAVVSAAVQGIFVAALYRYATEHRVAPGFRLENFSMAWQRK